MDFLHVTLCLSLHFLALLFSALQHNSNGPSPICVSACLISSSLHCLSFSLYFQRKVTFPSMNQICQAYAFLSPHSIMDTFMRIRGFHLLRGGFLMFSLCGFLSNQMTIISTARDPVLPLPPVTATRSQQLCLFPSLTKIRL